MRAAVPVEESHLAGLLAALPDGERPDMDEVARGVACAAYARALVAGDDVLCVFGVVPADGYGAAWMLGTPHTSRHRFWFTREMRRQVAGLLEMFPRLRVVVSHRYDRKTVAWLRLLGWAVVQNVDWRGEPHRLCEVGR